VDQTMRAVGLRTVYTHFLTGSPQPVHKVSASQVNSTFLCVMLPCCSFKLSLIAMLLPHWSKGHDTKY
jgi:hypothetical protein